MKSDKDLGLKVHQHLVSIGMETPVLFNGFSNSSREHKISVIEEKFKNIMDVLELNRADDSLIETPHRIAKMYVDEFFYGLDYKKFPKCTAIENKMDAGMVIERNIKVMSNCEHHFVQIDGVANVAYIPKNKVIGLSKINRIVDFFCRRPQVQERLTNQIWHTLSFILETEDVAVYMDAVHYCVRGRGVADANSSTITNKLGGEFMKDPATRAEFMSFACN